MAPPRRRPIEDQSKTEEEEEEEDEEESSRPTKAQKVATDRSRKKASAPRKTNVTKRPKRGTYSEHVREHYSTWDGTATLISPGMWRLFLDNRRYDASGSFPLRPTVANSTDL